ncbi:exopolysaccharide biosynthesis polyprenyl glycosylphosphotransferase [Chryseobacterium wangxinyae]|uniref:exopolysaccharide biosynthesis polyprenyl glycosylphosphotransferase n=1 Tax=Chryseobacterium sp. CY353 TaxID=2997334 RepID=UPI00226EAC64|nr:exopolysaccharide biosynthesis polyprenyl glycosylphosphotransferase [Chryseobacterium sp. CY353]MCY0970063.1 exopolysaccharide biosynthesis polyprenyl glycosylphosphotransferase [Chryseobacterium sp. CY353]
MLVYFIKRLPNIFLVIDYIIINFFFVVLKLFFLKFNISFFGDYTAYLILLNILWFVITIITNLYRALMIRDSSLHFNALAKSFFLLIISSLICFYLFPIKVSYSSVIFYFVLIGFFMTLIRFLSFLYRKKNRIKLGRKLFSFNTILIGESSFSKSLLSNNHLRRSMGIRGMYSSECTRTKSRYLGGIDKLFTDLDTTKVTSIIFCDDKIDLDIYKKIVDVAEHKMIRVYMVPNFKYINIGPSFFEVINDMPFQKLIREPLSNSRKQVLKRIFDIGFSLFVIVFVLSWLIPLVAFIVKMESNESVFFRQKRSGLNNEPFNCIKFRSMMSNKNADLEIAKKNDQRITKFGAFMRKTSIDELPQFINVFLGEMSVVGPRPHMISQTEMYSKITKKYMTRHIVKPGITGWAQVMGSRGEIFTHNDMERRVEKDIWYIQNWSFFLDLKIIFLTLYNIVKGDDQAY